VIHTTAKTKIASMNLRVDEIEVEAVVEVVHTLASAPIVEVEVEVVALVVVVIDTEVVVHLDEDHAQDPVRLAHTIHARIINTKHLKIMRTMTIIAVTKRVLLRQKEKLVHALVLAQEIVAHRIQDHLGAHLTQNIPQIKTVQI
jgi:hypothetical protein